MIKGIWIVFRKELLDTVRDRRTLMFMLVVPTLMMPLIMLGVTKFMKKVNQERALEPVVVVADADTEKAYLQLAHKWFLGSEFSGALKVASSPIFRALLTPEMKDKMPPIPADIFSDPFAFRRWSQQLVTQARQSLDSDTVSKTPELKALPKKSIEMAREFYTVAIKGVGLVNFVRPDSLAAPRVPVSKEQIREELRSTAGIEKIAAAILDKRVQGYLQIPPGVEDLETKRDSKLQIVFVHDSTLNLSGEAFDRVEEVAKMAGEKIVKARLESKHLEESFIKPVAMREETDLASGSKRLLSQLGGMIPYIVIIFSFLGAIYPAIDLGAGEKERNTLETLLLSPCSRVQLATGKFLVILTTSLIASLLAVTSMTISMKQMLPAELFANLDIKIQPVTLVMTALLAVPAAATFSGMLLAISIYARSFKEAQSYMAPAQFIIIFPAMAALIPGLEINWKLALIPLVNISLLAREFIKGDVNWLFYGETVLSSSALAAICIALAVRMFGREEVLFRT